eukprot:403359053
MSGEIHNSFIHHKQDIALNIDTSSLLQLGKQKSKSKRPSHILSTLENIQSPGGAGGDLTSNEGSPQNIKNNFFENNNQRIYDELMFHKDAYEKVTKFYPPNPILPKNFQVQEGSPRSGGEFAFLKLTKFRGKDFGKSKFEIDHNVNQIQFPDSTSLKSIFIPLNESEDKNVTSFGELVYMRSAAIDFSNKIKEPGQKKDEVLEENLIDVRRILKNSTQNKAQENMNQIKDQNPNQRKVGLVSLHGVDQYYKKKDQFDKTLIFESRFESGNLASALKVNDDDYHLLLQNDVNTSGHTQWFFFRVANTKKYSEVRFNMLNLSKPDSLFNEGMKVLIFSEKQSEDKDIGWFRGGTKISYYNNGIKKESQKRSKCYYTLTFSYEFQYDDDIVYFAYCYPYTYTDLQEELNRISNDPIKSQFCARKTLCQSVAENKIEMLTITSRQNLDNLNKRKGVFLTARVHPGESVGSWMMKGAIDFLTDESNQEAELLRQNYVFKIIPMLNPDGVINGNYRCSLAGCDLNRRWKAPSKVLHPCVYYTKQIMQNFAKERELSIFCDFHGHSRRKNIFMYGCHVPSQPEDTRLFPFLLSKLCPFFVYGLSRFGNQRSKEATARIAMFNDLKIPAIYTMESSFCGNDQGPFANYHFSTDNLIAISTNILTEILQLHCHYKEINDLRDVVSKDQEVEIMKIFVEKIQLYREKNPEIKMKHLKKALSCVLRQTQDLMLDGETTSSAGSDQAPSEDNMEPEEIQNLVPVLDEEGQKKGSKKKRDIAQSQEMATSISPMRRKNTMEGGSQSANLNAKNKIIMNNKNKRLSMLKTQDPQLGKGSGSKVLLTNSRRGTIDENKINEEHDIDEAQKNPQGDSDAVGIDDTVTHKKKRKRNVESRDAWTQTERSDYMLIKYRQKQKLAMQMIKSQKFTKEEQKFYEQALAQHNQQKNNFMNKTQDFIPSTNSSVNMPLSKLMKNGNTIIPGGQQTLSNQIQQSVMGQGTAHIKLANNYSISNTQKQRKSDNFLQTQNISTKTQKHQQSNSTSKQSQGGVVGTSLGSNYSRNVQSQQSNSRKKVMQGQNNAVNNGQNQGFQKQISSNYMLSNAGEQLYSNSTQNEIYHQLTSLQVKSQGSEQIARQSLQQQQFSQQMHPYQNININHAFANTQQLSNLDRLDQYQSNRMNTINVQQINNGVSTNQVTQNKNQSLIVQTVLPQIQTPNQAINKKKLSHSGIIPSFVQNNMNLKKSQGDASIYQQQQQYMNHTQGSGGIMFQGNNSNKQVRVQDNHSDLSSNHSTNRNFVGALQSSGIGLNSTLNSNQLHKTQPLHSSFIEAPQFNNTFIKTSQQPQKHSNNNLPKSLPPKPQYPQSFKGSTNTSDIMVIPGIVQLDGSNNEQYQQQQQMGNIRVLENAYIQQKLLQQQQDQQQIGSSSDKGLRQIQDVDYDTIRISEQDSNPLLKTQPKQSAKGNFFQNASSILEPSQSNTPYINSKAKGKTKSDQYSGNGQKQTQNFININNSNGGMQGQSIKKMIESQWKAVQQQQLSQSFYNNSMVNPNSNSQFQNQQQFFGTSSGNAFAGLNYSPMKVAQGSGVNGVQRLKKNANNNIQSQQRTQHHNQFINVQGILPTNTINSGQISTNNNGKVKISIVNVHNEFIINPSGGGSGTANITNVNNNFIISNSGQVSSQAKHKTKNSQSQKKR